MATTTLQALREYAIDHYGLGRRGGNTGTSASVLTDDTKFGGHGAQSMLEVGCPVLITSNRLAITGATDASPIEITTAAHSFATGDVVDIWGVTPNTAANGRWTITVTAATTFTLDGSTGNGATAAAGFATTPTAAPAEEQSHLASVPALTTGAMNLDPSLSTTTAGTFEVLYKPLCYDAQDGPFSLHGAITETLRNYALLERREVPITLVTDGDMLSSVTTSWENYHSGTPTLAKADLGYPNALRVIRMTAGAAADAIYSCTLGVEELTSYFLEVTGLIGTGGAAADAGTLIAYDVTNAAAITLDQYTIDRFEPEILMNSFTTPSGCEQVRIVLQADANGDIIEWANVQFRKNNSREFTIADRPIPPGYLGRLLATTEGAWGARGDTMREVRAKPVQMGGGIWQYHTQENLAGQSLWYEEYVQKADLTLDTQTTTVIVEDLAALTAERLLKGLVGYSEHFTRMYQKAMEAAGRVTLRYQGQRAITGGSYTQPQHHGV